ncbi:hypothetical protein HCU66_26325 [Pseudomonas frederiksbergensis]|nr:hypothetical protein [Pseudomonas frederiksbergensis]
MNALLFELEEFIAFAISSASQLFISQEEIVNGTFRQAKYKKQSSHS